jgi:hypothetical protein
METENYERPVASPQFEQIVHEQFPLDNSPEDYAARQGHRWACFSLDNYQFRDKKLDAWIQRLGQIFFTRGLIDQCRRELLTPQELEQVEREMAEEF